MSSHASDVTSTPRIRTLLVPCAALALGLAGCDALSAPDPDVARGNQLFASEAFADALAAYRAARAEGEREAALAFNQGAALYRLAERAGTADERARLLADARTAYRRAAAARDRERRSWAYLGLGNALFRGGQLADAEAAYRDALRADSDNHDARYNLELVAREREVVARSEAADGAGGVGDRGSDTGNSGDRGSDTGSSGDRGSDTGEPGSDTGEPGSGEGPAGEGPAGEDPADSGQGESPGAPGRGADTSGSGAPRTNDGANGPDGADGPDGDRARRPAGFAPRATELERKLERLDRLSRELRRRQLERARPSIDRPPTRGPVEDW